MSVSERWHFGPLTVDEWEERRGPACPAHWSAGRPGRVSDVSPLFFKCDPRWTEYLREAEQGATSFISMDVVNDLSRVQRRRTRAYSDGEAIDVDVRVPAAPFREISRERAQALFGLVARDTWVWLSHRCGFPLPPSLPGPLAQWRPEELVSAQWRGVEAGPSGREVMNEVEWRARDNHVRDRSAGLFREATAWQEWLSAVDPRELYTVITVVDDVPEPSYEEGPLTGEPEAEPDERELIATVPADGLAGTSGDEAAEAYARVHRQTYAWLAELRGWPPPPPAPTR